MKSGATSLITGGIQNQTTSVPLNLRMAIQVDNTKFLQEFGAAGSHKLLEGGDRS